MKTMTPPGNPRRGCLRVLPPRVPTQSEEQNGGRRGRDAMLHMYDLGTGFEAGNEAWQRARWHHPVDDCHCGECQPQNDRDSAHASLSVEDLLHLQILC